MFRSIYPITIQAMFVTSFTTMAAFLSTSISDIIPIGTFGLFAGSLVAFNYLLDIVFLPAVVVVWEIHFRHNPRLSSAVSRIIHPIKKALGSSQKEVEKPDPAPVVDFPGHKDEFEAKDILEDNELRWMERFFYTYWIDFVQKYRYIIILAFATLFGLSIAAATQLSPLR